MLPASANAAGRWAWGAIAFTCAVIAAPAMGEDGGYRVYGALETIRFERHCTDAEAHRVQAHVGLESENEGASSFLKVVAFARQLGSGGREGVHPRFVPEYTVA